MPAPVVVTDLLCGAGTLAGGLRQALTAGDRLDAYLLAAGLTQLVEDRLHPDPLLLFRAGSYLRGLPSAPARFAGSVSGGLGSIARARASAAHRRLLRARHALADLAGSLAAQVMTAQPDTIPLAPGTLATALAAVGDLDGDVMRVPACFHDFDQHPDDVRWLAAEVRRWLAERGLAGAPLCVVGVRTSGSYLAPLHAAVLSTPPPGSDGPVRSVGTLTYRPGRPFLRWERARLAALARAGGVAVITDDPPGSGESLADAASALARAGFPATHIVVAYSSFAADGHAPPRLAAWQTVVQPWPQWSIHTRLRAESVRKALAALSGPAHAVVDVAPMQPFHDRRNRSSVYDQRVSVDHENGPAAGEGPGGQRGHARAWFTVTFADAGGETVRRDIVVEGAGLGYFGRRGMAVAGLLPDRVPHVYGFADGLVFRDWLPRPTARSGTARDPAVPEDAARDPAVPEDAARDPAVPEDAARERAAPPADAGTAPAAGDLAQTIADYVAARQRALPAAAATPRRLRGRDPAWEVAAMLLARQFGPLGVPARPLLLEPVVRRLLTHQAGSVPDGKTDARHWLPDPAAGGGLRKVDFYQRSFGHLDLACADPVFDLAGAAADPPAPGFPARLREVYGRATGERVDGERWLLYRLAHLWRLTKASDLAPYQARQLSAAAIHDYLAELYLRGLPPADGPLAAIDLDGVLECDSLGCRASSPTGVLALRALIAHGYRPVLATGRSLPEVADRCAAFGLVGGIAEYGAALLLQAPGETGPAVADLRPEGVRGLMAAVRHGLAALPGVRVDPRYAYGVRASASRGGPLPPGALAAVPELASPDVRVIHGDDQTDISPAGVDKGTGMDAFAARLGGPAWALAVGDSVSDLPMLRRAVLARGPRNSSFGAAAGVSLTRRGYQGGLAAACAGLLGHQPGQCPACRPPAFAPRTRAMLAILDLRADGLAGLPTRSARLAALAARPW